MYDRFEYGFILHASIQGRLRLRFWLPYADARVTDIAGLYGFYLVVREIDKGKDNRGGTVDSPVIDGM